MQPALVPAVLMGAAAAVLLLGPPTGRRLADVLPAGRPAGAVPPGALPPGALPPGAGPAVAHPPAARRAVGVAGPRGACVLGGLAVALLLGSAVGVVLGVAVALAGPRVLARLEPGEQRRRREELARDLPLALDLLAACLTGGAPLQPAVAAVAAAVPGACGARLLRVASALGVGSPPAEAWSALADGDGAAAPAARALARSAESGAPVAATVARLAADVRAEARARGEQAAKRAGVLAVAPLGLCFLPAFVLLGVVPVVVGLAGPLLGQL